MSDEIAKSRRDSFTTGARAGYDMVGQKGYMLAFPFLFGPRVAR